ncbi:Kelch repeat type 1 [Corchorus capsularis]|uniref:Kelch repeat type 1 n=1 Tax=Corchorus capsularis TaxID=210143 RepID=A0A1R3IFU3_COCAP|nr:Kelch repeat type 1 [Corchorus capsularis]
MSKSTPLASRTARQFLKPSIAASPSSSDVDGKVDSTACAFSASTPGGTAPAASFGTSSMSSDWVTSIKPDNAETTKSDNKKETEHEKSSVYLPYERLQSECFCMSWHAFNLEESKGGPLEIPRSLHIKESVQINVCPSAVALGSVIYLIGGCCGYPVYECYQGRIGPHFHNSVVYFDTLRPGDGWREAAPMISDRNLPTVVAVDGKIFVFGALFRRLSPQPLVEFYDPKENCWTPLPDYPYLKVPRICMPAAVHDKRILFQPDKNSLHSLNICDYSWNLIDENFGYWDNPGAVMDDILYIYSIKSKQVHGYDLINKTWLDVEFPGLGQHIKTAALHNVGNGKLCLFYRHYNRTCTIVCNTFKIRKENNGDKLLHLTDIKVSRTSFDLMEYRAFWDMNILML